MITDLDRKLCQALCDHPRRHHNRYTPKAQDDLLETLFRSLTNDRSDYFAALFPHGFPTSHKLQDAQGTEENAEYTAAAKGHPCGHIFQQGEACYHCMTCADDATCVLCSRCFDSSDHEGHQFHISPSTGNSGCCDCGDEEAWKRPVNCAIHTSAEAHTVGASISSLPTDLQSSIRTTISRVLDYFCDVISCSPENLRVPKTIETIKHDETCSRLGERYFAEGNESEPDTEYCMVLWNDEKHTVAEVVLQVARGCRERERFGDVKAHEAHHLGRSVIKHSHNLAELIKQAKVIEETKLTVTIRSSRDTFREQMCGTIVEWLSDIAACSMLGDSHVLRRTICEEMLQQWRVGSAAYNARVGRTGIDIHGLEASRYVPAEQAFQRLIHAGVLDGVNDVNEGEDMRGIDETDAAEEEAEDEAEVEAEDEDDDYDQDMDDSLFDRRELDDLDEMQVEPQGTNANLRGGNDPDGMDTDGDGEFIDVSEFITIDPLPPPPPPPPHLPPHHGDITMSPSESEAGELNLSVEGKTTNFQNIPKTPSLKHRSAHDRPPNHWAILPPGYSVHLTDVPAYEDLSRNIRLDSMILFDLRLWKQTRIQLRDLYINTVVNIPEFKRILGLRFSGLYTTLSQLYLVADREPDHSIMNLSLQMLTTPSITKEVIERGNFLTNLMAILYTYLTTRQVGFPKDVDPNATLIFETGSVINRRLIHFFTDLRWYLASPFVQERVRTDKQYLLQYLDLAKLSQGVCPNLRAIGEHVEYETDVWINAAVLTREINRLCRHFAEAFHNLGGKERLNADSTCDAIFHTARVTIANCIGLERKRFEQNEVKGLARFKALQPFEFERSPAPHRVIDFVVEKGAMSFHHALHYTLSWLLEFGNDSHHAIESLVEAAVQTVRGLSESRLKITFLTGEDALLSLFDYPLRVCAWLAQMKAGMWVRNGLSLRHQMHQYKSVGHRDVGHHRDLVLLQTALVACDPTRVLASMLDRFGLEMWMRGKFESPPECEDTQMLDIAEDFVFLLINLLSDRDALIPPADEPNTQVLAIRKDIIHTLCFKSLSFSDLSARLTERVQDQQQFQDVLESLTTYRPPEGLHDSGMFELKSEYLSELDPYNSHFSKNQRDEAETIYKHWMAKNVNKPSEDIVLEPMLRPIRSGAYVGLAAITSKPLFAQVLYRALEYVQQAKSTTPGIPITRLEGFLHIVLQLALIATLEDDTADVNVQERFRDSFIHNALQLSPGPTHSRMSTIVTVLHKLSNIDEFTSCRSKIKHMLKLFVRKRESEFKKATAYLEFPFGRLDTASPANIENEVEAKKKHALERKSKIMAQFQQQQQTFMDKHGMIDWGDDDLNEPETDIPSSIETRLWKYPSGVCIHCREETNDSRLYGTFAMIIDGHVLRQTDVGDPDFVREAMNIPESLDQPIEHLRPYGVAGANYEKIRRLNSEGHEVVADRQGLGKGWPRESVTKDLLSTSCGHIMHYACFENYYASVSRRQSHQIARNHPERLSQKEFVCPLCKAMGNTFLPILWKNVEQSYPGNLTSLRMSWGFDAFLERELSQLFESQDNSAAYRASVSRLHQETLSTFSNAALASAIPEWYIGDKPDLPSFTELVRIYTRLKETLVVAGQSIVSNGEETFDKTKNNFGHLVRAFANTVAATEIALRGQISEYGSTLLSRIPQQTLAHLRILASTAESYAVTGSLTLPGAIKIQLGDLQKQSFLQLFFTHVRTKPEEWQFRQCVPLLVADPFITFTEYSFGLFHWVHVDLHPTFRLCYTAELLRVMIVYLFEPDGLLKLIQQTPVDSENSGTTLGALSPEIHALTATIDWMVTQFAKFETSDTISGGQLQRSLIDISAFPPTVKAALFRLISAHALVFLRKTIVLFHVALRVDFPVTGASEDGLSELDRLSRLLRLPNITTILMDFSEFSGKMAFKDITAGWIEHLVYHIRQTGESNGSNNQSGSSSTSMASQIKLLHPAPLELIGLPKYFDALMEESHRRKCPTTGKELTDPAMCLFCGEIFCAQAYCCMHDRRRGGCNMHVEKCSDPIGIFLFIRKCQILMLHVATVPKYPERDRERRDSGSTESTRVATTTLSNGSFFPAPYLTKHGETDSGLRSKYQLILNQRRYDKLLRETWLMSNASSTVWSAVARKLEGEVNAGGWETL